LDAFDKVDARLYLHLMYKALDEPMRRALKEEKMLRGQYPDVELELPGFVYEMAERAFTARTADELFADG